MTMEEFDTVDPIDEAIDLGGPPAAVARSGINPAPKVPTWNDVMNDPQIKGLPDADREKARNAYFKDVVQPRIPKEQLRAARIAFDKDTLPKPGVEAAPAKGPLGQIWDFAKDTALTTLGLESPKSESFGGDTGRSLAKGATVDVGQTVIGANEMARAAPTMPNLLSRFAEAALPQLKQWREGATTSALNVLEQRGRTISGGMTEESQKSMQKQFFQDDATWKNLSSEGLANVPKKIAQAISEGKMFGTGWWDPRKIALSAVESVPVSVASMAPAVKVAGMANELAVSRALAAGVSAKEAAALGVKAAERAAMVVGGTSEGAVGGAQQYSQTYQQVMEMPQEKLDASPEYQRALDAQPKDLPAEERAKRARHAIAESASLVAAAVATVADTLFAGLGDRYLGTAAAGKGSRLGAAARGIAQELPTETAQSAAEQFGTNLGIKQFADPTQELGQDVGEQAVGGGLSGGLMGGGMGAASYSSRAAAAAGINPTAPVAANEAIEIPRAAAGTRGIATIANQGEQALTEPVSLTNLDRVNAIDQRIGELASTVTPQQPATPEVDDEIGKLRAERGQLTAAWPKMTEGAPTTFSTESGVDLSGRYALAEADDLVSSHDTNLRKNPGYPQELQPRARERAASELQVSNIVQKLNPARLGESPDVANGTPIIGADGLVESGNARTIALKRIYQANGQKAATYRAWLAENAGRFGLTPEQVTGMKNPVLVRVRETPVNRAEFARQANAPTTAQMSPLEQAHSDAAKAGEGAANTQAGGAPVETFSGQYGKGLTALPARQAQQRLAKEKPALDWRIEQTDKLEHPYIIVGYNRPAATPATQNPAIALAAPIAAAPESKPTVAPTPLQREATVPLEPAQREAAIAQPWQMTRAEFVADRRAALAEKAGANNPSLLSASKGERFGKEAEIAHRTSVEKALSEGKPVPANVLADYPDLKPQTERRHEARATPERRHNAQERKRVSELSIAEARTELLTDHLTGIANKRAYQEAERLPIQVSIDLDMFKQINDTLGHEAGDEVLKATAEALARKTGRAFRFSGDEFVIEAHTQQEAEAIMQSFRDTMAKAKIEITTPDGQKIVHEGVGVSYGIGRTFSEADQGLRADKAGRKAAGLRRDREETARGGGVLEQGAEGRKDQGNAAPEEVAPQPAQQAVQAPAERQAATPQTPANAGVAVSGTDATLARFRPRKMVIFSKPYVGKTGAKLTGYEWKWRPESVVDKHGEDRDIRVSDWEEAVTNPATNRDIVHQFQVETTDGRVELVNAETAATMLGVSDSTARSAAKRLLEEDMRRQETEERTERHKQSLEAKPWFPTPAAAIDGLQRGLQKVWGRYRAWGEAKRAAESGDYAAENQWREMRSQKIWFTKGPKGYLAIEEAADKIRGWENVELTPEQIWDENGNDKTAPRRESGLPEKSGNAKTKGKIEDSGENLWYNRRNFTGKALAWDDVKSLNDSLKVKEVVKSKVWPRPDYEQLVTDGMQPFFARMLKQVYDGIATVPAGRSDADMERYISAVGRIRDAVFDWAKDNNSNTAFLNEIADRARASMGKRFNLSDLVGKNNANVRDVIMDRVWPESVGQSSRFRDGEPLADARIIGGNKALRAMQFTLDDAVAAMKDIEKGWPKAQEAWQRQGYRVAPSSQAVINEGKRYDRSGASTPSWSVSTAEGWAGMTISSHESRTAAETARSALKPFMLLDKRGRLISQHATEDEARAAARELTKREAKGGEIRGMNIAEAERTGPARRLSEWTQSLVNSVVADAQRASDSFSGKSAGLESFSLSDIPTPTTFGPNPTRDERAAYVAAVNLKFLGNLNEAGTLSIESFSKLDIPRKRHVLSAVIAGTENPNIRERVIELVPVDVVGMLSGQKLSADDLLSDKAVLRDALAIDEEVAVAAPNPSVLALIRAVARNAAKDSFLNAAFVAVENNTAIQTGNLHHRRTDRDISAEEFNSTFGFRATNFGREGWINQTERQAYLNHAYDALQDLADVLNVPPKALSLNGMLGIAFGAQGRGGHAAAHFIPGVNEINLTKTMGAGTLAHEWGHALDHYFANQAGLAKSANPFLSENLRASAGAEIRPEIIDAMKEVVQAMSRRSPTPEEYVKHHETVRVQTQQGLDRLIRQLGERIAGALAKDDKRRAAALAEYGQLADRIRRGDLGDGYVQAGNKQFPPVIAQVRNLVKDATGRLASLDDIQALDSWAHSLQFNLKQKESDAEHIPQQRDTTYQRESVAADREKGGKGYWATKREMFARAFETYVAGELADRAQKNTFLSDAAIRALMMKPDGKGFAMPYPRNEDRKAVNTAFDRLVGEIKTRETDMGVAVFSRGEGQQNLADRIDAILRGESSITPIYLGETPAILQRLGMKPLPMGMDESVVDKAMFDHGVISRELKTLADAIADPVAVVDSESKIAPPGSLVVITDLVKSDGRPIIVGIHPNKEMYRITINEIASVYPKDNAKKTVARWLAERLRYVNNEKRPEWQRLAGVQFPGKMPQRSASSIVLNEREIVKTDRQAQWGTDPFVTKESEFGKLSREGTPVAGMKATDLERQLAPIIANDKNLPGGGVKIVQSFDDLPAQLRDFIQSIDKDNEGEVPLAQSAQRTMQGVWDPATKAVYLVADHIDTATRAQFTLFHELYGHYGMRGLFGKSLDKSLRHIYAINKNVRKEAERQKRLFDYGHELAIEEALANLAGKGQPFNGLRALLRAMQTGLRAIGLNRVADWLETLSNAEALAFLAQAKWYVQGENQPRAIARDAVPAMSRMSRGAPDHGSRASWDAPEPGKLDKLIHILQDKQIDTKRVIQSIKNASGALTDAIDVYLQEELFHGRAAKGTNDFLNNELNPLLTDMAARGIRTAEDIQRFEEFLWARHAAERNAQIARVNPDMPDGGSGMTSEEAAAVLAAIDPQKRRDYEALAKRADAITKNTRQELIEYGLESPGTIRTWELVYKHYVPLYREDMEGGLGTGQGFSVRGPTSKRALGSRRGAVDILAHIALQRERAIVRGEKNRVATALLGLAVSNPNPDFWKVDVPPKIRYIDQATGLVAERVDPLYKSRENVVMVRVPNMAGEVVEHAVVFNERDERAARMVTALKNLDAHDLGEVLGLAAKVTRYFASINTQYNPIFGVVNLVRDTQGALFNLSSTPIAGRQKEVLQHAMSALRGIYLDERAARRGEQPSSSWAQLWDEFQKEGGQTGYRDMFRTSKDRADAIMRALDPDAWTKTTWGKVLTAKGYLEKPELLMIDKVARPVFEWLTDYNQTMENAIRLAAYKVGKDHGLSNQRAASLAKNLTVNFNRKGSWGVQLGSLYAFFNASIQGTARLAETLRGPAGKRIIAGGMLLGVMQAILLAAAFDDPDDPPEFVRERNLIIPIGDGRYVTIPMPLGLHMIPNIGRIPAEYALHGFRDAQKYITNFLNVFSEAFNPIGNAGLSLQTIAPTAIDPIAALAENRDWTGKPIARENMNALAPTPGYTRAKETASEFSKAVSKALNWLSGGTEFKPGIFSPTPDQIDYLIGQATGGLGREAMKVEQATASAVTGDELPAYKIPLLGRFYGSTRDQASQANAFYENIKQLAEHEAEIKGRSAAGERVDVYLRENPEAALIFFANTVERQVSNLRNMKRKALERGATKEEVKRIDEQITQLMRIFNEKVRATRDAKAA